MNTLDDAMAQRQERGWRREPDGWTFGLGGTALLIVDEEPGGFLVYDDVADAETFYASIDALLGALDALEQQRRGLTPLQRSILDADDVPLDADMLTALQEELARQDAALGPPDHHSGHTSAG